MAEEKSVQEPTDSAAVFESLKKRLEADDPARSLWQKFGQEMKAGGVSGAVGYLRARFADLSARVTSELDRMAGH